MPDVILIGGGGHASVVLDVLRRLGHHVVGFAAPSPDGARVAVPYLGPDEEVVARYESGAATAAFGVVKVDVGSARTRVLDIFARAGFPMPPIVAPTATVHAGVEMGEGSVVLDGAVVATGSRLGRGCIVNTNASVDHDCRLGDDVHVAPGATVGGDVRIGAGSLVGAGATVIHGLRVCGGVLVGAGATVVRDIDAADTYLGTPARRA